MSAPLTVGLTGNIGSGKTTICKVFETIGVPVFYADKVARELLEKPNVVQLVVDQFGNSIVMANGKISRPALASIVFNDKQSLQRLNEIVHPLVRNEFKLWVAVHQDFPYLIQEAAILFETGLYKEFDKIIVVSAPEDTRIERVMKRDKVTRDEVLARASNQLSQDVIESKADFIIVNHGKVAVLPQVLEIDNILKTFQQK